MNGVSGIRTTPAGKLMNVRTTGSRRLNEHGRLAPLREEAVGDLDLVLATEQVAGRTAPGTAGRRRHRWRTR